jgi:hypothetical protein
MVLPMNINCIYHHIALQTLNLFRILQLALAFVSLVDFFEKQFPATFFAQPNKFLGTKIKGESNIHPGGNERFNLWHIR